MKILLLSPLPPATGGLSRWTERYLASITQKVTVDVVNTALIGKRSVIAGEKRHWFEEIIRAISIISATRNNFSVKNYDLIHINSACSRFGIIRDYICAKIANKKKSKVLLHCHCNITDQLGNGKIANYFFDKLLSISNTVLVLNEQSRIFAMHRCKKANVVIMPNYIKRDQIAEKHNINKKINKVVFVGDVRVSKGCKEIYEVAEKFSDVEFQIIGPYTEEMDDYSKPSNVELLGVIGVEKVYQYLDEADIFLFPTHTEGFSNALLEAMARGIPVITTAVGANEDMIEARGGIIVPVSDSNKIINAFKKLQSSNIRSEMSEWNISKVISSYEEQIVMERLLRIYEDTCA